MELEGWDVFFTASAGASAALVGLIIVAMSVNIEHIVKYASLPARAGSTIANLTLVLVVSVLALIPGITHLWVGVIVIVAALVCLGFAIDSAVRIFSIRADAPKGTAAPKASVGIAPVVLTLIGGIMEAAGAAGGLQVVAVGFGFMLVASVINAWVLLVEIRR